ncbi:GTP-binding protein [Mesorhizobium microcysteis]|uniref:GTP-binding protein n=1 Tax=Neoaquamicrobium microcysteis TaxID=2682781 RepID=A0A5D4H472_9HYPH|nr:CobW family GTP-binding protein [Mesorhizobium microcysteis]TYR35468.1 GTP-binding protein [Mesorhizobium microcysteis]
MSTPVVVVTGYLGAGKTTLINALLADADGRHIAAIVNDFGAINIDEELIRTSTDSVIGLANGCVCCTLQGDLLRTLKLLLARTPPPDHIVIEASGIADPSGIAHALADPVLWKTARLDAVVCVVDAEDVTQTSERRADTLWRAQLAGASFVVLSKTSGLEAAAVAQLTSALSPNGKPPVIDADSERLPIDLLLDAPAPPGRFTATETVAPHRQDRFTKLEWRSDGAIVLSALQGVIAEFAASVVRAKGILHLAERPDRAHLLQLVGQRVTLEPMAGRHEPGCRLVLIGEAARLDTTKLAERLDAAAEAGHTATASLARSHPSA